MFLCLKYNYFYNSPSPHVNGVLCVCRGLGVGEYTVFTMSVHIFWFLLRILLSNIRKHFFFHFFCVNVDIEEMLLFKKNKSLGVNSLHSCMTKYCTYTVKLTRRKVFVETF